MVLPAEGRSAGPSAIAAAERTASATRAHVLPPAAALCSLRVTHAEARRLLPGYAAGDLGAAEADGVRAHLVTGCAECLDDLFRRPVGMPQPELPDDVPARAARLPARRGLAGTAVAALTLGLMVLVAWTAYDVRRREALWEREVARGAARLSQVEAAQAERAARAEALERDLAEARAEAVRQAEAARAAAEASAELRRDLEAAQDRSATLTRGVRRRDAEIDRLLGAMDEQRTVRELLGTPGVEVLHLKPVPPFDDVRGHVLWHPARDAVVLYVFGLPDGGTYRVRLGLDDGRVEAIPSFKPGPRGDVALPIRLRVSAAHLRELEVVRDPAEPVLTAHTGGPANSAWSREGHGVPGAPPAR